MECGRCGELSQSRAQFLHHARMSHNGLARPKGEPQEFEEKEEQRVLADTMAAVQQLRCGVCLHLFHSLLGFKMHSLGCGLDPSQLNKACPVCRRRIRYYYLDAHMKKHAAAAAVLEDERTGRARGSRKAAMNCNLRLQAWRSARTEDGGGGGGGREEDGDDYRQELSLARYYTRPDPSLSPSLLEHWGHSLAQGQGADCPHDGCTHRDDSLGEARRHYWACPLGGPALALACTLCSFTSHHQPDMEDHLLATHTEEVAAGGQETDDDEDDDDDDDDSDEEVRGSSRPRASRPSTRRGGRGSLQTFLPAMAWTLEFLNDTMAPWLFPSHLPRPLHWLPLPPADATPYLPALAASPSFKVEAVTTAAAARQERLFGGHQGGLARHTGVGAGQQGQAGKGSGWHALGRFEGAEAGRGAAMFCGGPVTSMAWCPQRPATSMAATMQHFALATVPTPDLPHLLCRSYTHPGLIQVWGCPGTKSAAPPVPTFLLGIAHDHGTVWSLVWCPSGSEEEPEEEPEASLPRLGLLAAACSDGTVLVYTVPRPEALGAPGQVYRPPPCLTLLMGRSVNMQVQCLKVDWCRAKGHQRVAGAMSSGVVCVWEVTNTSPLLAGPDGALLPLRVFPAHNGVCTAVAFCPTTGGRHLLTGGNDRTYKFWDLERPELPLSVVRRGLVLDALWLTHWAGGFLAFDDVYGLGSTNSCFKESGFFGITSRTVLSSNAAAWALAGSDWLNCVAQGDSGGEVTLTVQQQLFRNYENEKLPSRRKVPVLSAHMQELGAARPHSFTSTRLPHYQKAAAAAKKAKAAEEEDGLGQNPYQPFPQTYREAAATHGIVFRDQNFNSFHAIPLEEMERRWRSDTMEASAVSCYPLMAVTCLAWNNNLGAHTWLLAGTQSGLARLARINALNSSDGNDFMRKNFGET